VVAALAAARITRLLVTDDFPPIVAVREWLLSRWPGDLTTFDEAEVVAYQVVGSGVPVVKVPHGQSYIALRSHWLGRLIECPWCLGAHISLVVVVTGFLWGDHLWWQIGATWMAVAEVQGLINSRLDS
jgi:hypothetical protein